MKVKFLAYAISLFAAATIGVQQLSASASEPGQVGTAPRCTVNADGARDSAFDIKNNVATVVFKISGALDCRVQVSANMFYAPSMNGRPYDRQTLFQQNTKIYSPGHYTLSVEVPAKSTDAKGCFYQVDLTYGTHNVLPVLAYGHGKLDCSAPPRPVASCDSLKVMPTTSRTKFNFVTTATIKHGATVKGYTYTVRNKDGQVVGTRAVTSTQTSNTYSYTQTSVGTYTVKVVVDTSEGRRNSDQCMATFVVKEAQKPSVSITKLVNGKKHDIVKLNSEFTYQLKLTNTGNVALNNVAVSDKAPEGVQFISAQPGVITNNTFALTINSLAARQSVFVTVKAKIIQTMPKTIVNTACVDTAETATKPDACDSATVDTPKPGKVEVCDASSGEIIMVDEDSKNSYVPADSEMCADIEVCVLESGEVDTIKLSEYTAAKSNYSTTLSECEEEEEESPKSATLPDELPKTGMVDGALQVTGAVSLVGATGYYLTSRRKL